MSEPTAPYIAGRIPKLPPQYILVVMPLLMSGFMSSIISMVNLLRSLGWNMQAVKAWPGAGLVAWAVAFPPVMVVMPLVKRRTQKWGRS